MRLFSIAPHASLVIANTTSDDVTSDFVQAGTIDVRHGALTLNIIPSGLAQTFQTISNTGTIEAEANASVTLHGSRAFTSNFATVDNAGTIATMGGSLDVQANLHQSSSGKLAATGGSILLEGATDGGVIQITNATLAFGLPGRTGPGGPLAAAQTTSPIKLSGLSDVLDFGRADIQEVFKPMSNELVVSVAYGGTRAVIADLHLVGTYATKNFSVHGNDVVFHA